MSTIAFTMQIEPRGQGRPRSRIVMKQPQPLAQGATVPCDGFFVPKHWPAPFVQVYKDPDDVRYEAQLAELAQKHRPKVSYTGSVYVGIVAVFARTQEENRVSKRTGLPLRTAGRKLHTKKPDLDNIAKAVLDAFKLWWPDDCQVCDLSVSKRIAAFGEKAHLAVTIAFGQEDFDVGFDDSPGESAADPWRRDESLG